MTTPAPSKTRTDQLQTPALQPLVALSNPALDQLQLELVRQNRQLDEAVSLAAGFAGVSFAVSPELLEEIERACTPRAASRGTLLPLARC
jgi:hypothetical protein